MFGGRLLAGEEDSLVVGEVHPQELLLLQRLHLRQVPDELVELVLVVQDVLKSCSMK